MMPPTDLMDRLAAFCEDAPLPDLVAPPVATLRQRARNRTRLRRGAAVGLAALVAASVPSLAELSGTTKTQGRTPADAVSGKPQSPWGQPLPTAAPSCKLSQLKLSLSWDRGPDGSLIGALRAENASSDACRTGDTPAVAPIGDDGTPSETTGSSWLVATIGGEAMAPGSEMTSTLVWRNWCGAGARKDVQVTLGAEHTLVQAVGPEGPVCSADSAHRVADMSASAFAVSG